ncbi:MAG: hypothetical protein K2N44_17535 [Lachnospiraceae bacterium]|nr:hypothetical protein [Lachnospiraceae bacterium]
MGSGRELLKNTPDEWFNQKGYRMAVCERHIVIYRQVAVYVYLIADTQTEYTKLFY